MGEPRTPEDDPVKQWSALVELGRSHPEFADVTDALASGGPPPRPGPSPLARAPMIIDTDIGGDPDDTVALVVAALTVPQLALVITCDEYGGQRARFARHLLDLAGRPDVPVVAGSDLGNTRCTWSTASPRPPYPSSAPISRPPSRRSATARRAMFAG